MNILAQQVKQHEETGAAFFALGRPVADCRSIAMRRGWQAAFDAATLEEQVEHQIAVNTAILTANRRMLAVRA